MTTCETHPDEELKPCIYCKKEICGICECYITPLSKVPITKEAYEDTIRTVRVKDFEWPKEPIIACLKCAQKEANDRTNVYIPKSV